MTTDPHCLQAIQSKPRHVWPRDESNGDSMRRMLRVFTLLVEFTLLATACGRTSNIRSVRPQAASYTGSIRPGCSPVDAPSIEIELHSLSGPQTIFFNLWPGAGVTAPTIVRFDDAHPIGAATFCPAESDCQAATWGQVALTHSDERAMVFGSWVIGLREGHTLRGTFQAERLALQASCG